MTREQDCSPFTEISYICIDTSSPKVFYNYTFFLVLDGSLKILREGEVFFLSKDDVFLFEPSVTYTTASGGDNVILSVGLDSSFIRQGKSIYKNCFQCNSSADYSRDYMPLRQILAKTSTTYFSGEENFNLRLKALGYNLLYYLNTYHYIAPSNQRIAENNQKFRERISFILEYIHANYASPLTLQDTADYLHLSVPYLSSFFKKQIGTNFNTYLNQFRLSRATEELLYTNHNITAIAFDNGFPNLNAFAKLFKDKYGVTPNKYRQQAKDNREINEISSLPSATQLSFDRYEQYLERYVSSSVQATSDISFPVQSRIEISDIGQSTQIFPIWKSMINIGDLCVFPHRDIEKQLAQAQSSIGFRYGRLGHVMDYNLYYDHTLNQYCFSAIDLVIDSIDLRGLIPYLALSVPIDQLNCSNDTIEVDLEKYLYVLEGLIKYILNGYGKDNVSKWYFEISPHRDLLCQKQENPYMFSKRFCSAYRLIRKYLPSAKVGGICHDTLFDFNVLKKVLSLITQEEIYPDFVSLGAYPFEPVPRMEYKSFFYTGDVDYVLHKVEQFKNIVGSMLKNKPEIHVAYMAPDRFNRYYLNDTLYQSCFIFHNTVALMEKVDMLGYYRLSDIGSINRYNQRFLAGEPGLLNCFGMRKPGFYLLEILAKCGENLVAKGANFVVLQNNPGNFAIGICNYTYIGDYDVFTTHQQISVQDAYKIYENPQTQKIEISVGNLIDGDYDVILFRLNKQHGSLMDEWARNGYINRFFREDLDFFRSYNQPLRSHFNRTVVNGTLDFQFQLAPQEIIFLFVFKKY